MNKILQSQYEISLIEEAQSNPMSLEWISGRAHWLCLCGRILTHICSPLTGHVVLSTRFFIYYTSSSTFSIIEPSFNSIAYWKKPQASNVVSWARKIVKLLAWRRTSQWLLILCWAAALLFYFLLSPVLANFQSLGSVGGIICWKYEQIT
jgi:hypothetical protein